MVFLVTVLFLVSIQSHSIPMPLNLVLEIPIKKKIAKDDVFVAAVQITRGMSFDYDMELSD
jgi:hypothetical protein